MTFQARGKGLRNPGCFGMRGEQPRSQDFLKFIFNTTKRSDSGLAGTKDVSCKGCPNRKGVDQRGGGIQNL